MLHDEPAAIGVPTEQSPALPVSTVKFVSFASSEMAEMLSGALPGLETCEVRVPFWPSVMLGKDSVPGLTKATGSHLP